MQRLAGPHMRADRFGQGLKQKGHMPHPIGKRRTFEIDAAPGIDTGLAVQRQVIAVLATSTWASKPGPGKPR